MVLTSFLFGLPQLRRAASSRIFGDLLGFLGLNRSRRQTLHRVLRIVIGDAQNPTIDQIL